MNAKSINQVLAEMDDLPETMSQTTINRSNAARLLDAPRSRDCTIDGITIYPSLAELGKVHGWGKEGVKHPNFRYLDGLGKLNHKSRGPLPAEHRAKIGQGQIGREGAGRLACTVDGITIYSSLKALSAALGHGKNGKKNPNLRFLSAEEVEAWKENKEYAVSPVPSGQSPYKPKRRERYKTPCTVDECVTVYASRGDLYSALGAGKAGRKNPALRLLTPEEIEVWNGRKEVS